jgi:hypothetical protein
VHMSMFVDIASEPRVSIRVNIAQFVGKRHGRQKDKGRKMYFADFNENDDDFRRSKLYPAFQKACRLAGFKSTNNGWEEGEQRVRFTCSQTRHFRRTASAVNENDETAVAGNTNRWRRNRTTSRPLAKEDQCCFMMPIFWDEVEKLWYMWERSAGNLQHNGHCELDPEEVKVSLSQLSDEDRELAFKMFNVNANTPMTQAFLEEQTGLFFSSNQLMYLRNTHRRDTLRQQDELFEGATAADRLLFKLEHDPMCSFIVVTAEWDTVIEIEGAMSTSLRTMVKHSWMRRILPVILPSECEMLSGFPVLVVAFCLP